MGAKTSVAGSGVVAMMVVSLASKPGAVKRRSGPDPLGRAIAVRAVLADHDGLGLGVVGHQWLFLGGPFVGRVAVVGLGRIGHDGAVLPVIE